MENNYTLLIVLAIIGILAGFSTIVYNNMRATIVAGLVFAICLSVVAGLFFGKAPTSDLDGDDSFHWIAFSITFVLSLVIGAGSRFAAR